MQPLTLATIIEPIGDLNAGLSGRLREAVRDSKRYGDYTVISLGRIPHVSWGALCELAEFVHDDSASGVHVRFTDIMPRMRSLMQQAGLGQRWIADRPQYKSERRVVIIA